ncbi:MAG: permease [Clostridia bacterium]|jgi:uncharacterized membrane protein YraQ (UPF0718 family)|nr:permease [Clostridia bacterium]MBT7123231.1 permease [Clostridia bacterium]
MKKFLKRYAFPIVMALALGALLIFNYERGVVASEKTFYTIKEMLFVIPPIFVLLGLLDVWVPRETMVRFLGEGSGIKGVLIAILIGSAAAGPLYAAFPVAAVFMKKGAKFSNIVLFIGAWSTTKIPMVAFELASLGPKFAFVRLGLSLVGICIIALIMHLVMKRNEVEQIYIKVRDL